MIKNSIGEATRDKKITMLGSKFNEELRKYVILTIF